MCCGSLAMQMDGCEGMFVSLCRWMGVRACLSLYADGWVRVVEGHVKYESLRY